MKKIRLNIDEAIKYIMEKYDIVDQYTMAKEIDVSQATISNYIKGNQYPKLVTAARIYHKYNVMVEPFTDKAIIKEWNFISQFEE